MSRVVTINKPKMLEPTALNLEHQSTQKTSKFHTEWHYVLNVATELSGVDGQTAARSNRVSPTTPRVNKSASNTQLLAYFKIMFWSIATMSA
jgi:hypothetical protein